MMSASEAPANVSELTLTGFLLARIAEDEASAEASSPGGWRLDEDGEAVRANRGAGPTVVTTIPLGYELRRANADHIARHDPARVLAECEAKRRIAQLHIGEAYYCYQDRPDGTLACDECGDTVTIPWPCPTLSALAAIYADHEDYRQEWRP